VVATSKLHTYNQNYMKEKNEKVKMEKEKKRKENERDVNCL